MCINFGPALQGGEWVRGGERWIGGEEGRIGGGEGGDKNHQVKTRDHQSPSDGPDHSTRPKGHHSG